MRHHNRRNLSGNHPAQDLLFRVLTDDQGRRLRLSAARDASRRSPSPRCNKLVERLRTHDLGGIGDLGFTGLDDDLGNPWT
ncbi:hypothetical protein [Streptomyces sp. NPDC056464]|uniref:hypothetical protein n=1 Tax=Streptomyces sp. NPDC056464 TaxID=3345828 RepID=UPI0036A123E6